MAQADGVPDLVDGQIGEQWPDESLRDPVDDLLVVLFITGGFFVSGLFVFIVPFNFLVMTALLVRTGLGAFSRSSRVPIARMEVLSSQGARGRTRSGDSLT